MVFYKNIYHKSRYTLSLESCYFPFWAFAHYINRLYAFRNPCVLFAGYSPPLTTF